MKFKLPPAQPAAPTPPAKPKLGPPKLNKPAPAPAKKELPKPKAKAQVKEPQKLQLPAAKPAVTYRAAPKLGPDLHSKRPLVPGIWQRAAAGVVLDNPKGPGYTALDNLCHANGWAWGIVASYERAEGTAACVSVLVGKVVEGVCQRGESFDRGTNAWHEIDQALSDAVRQLEESHGAKG